MAHPPSPDERLDDALRATLAADEAMPPITARPGPLLLVLRSWLDGFGLPAAPRSADAWQRFQRRLELAAPQSTPHQKPATPSSIRPSRSRHGSGAVGRWLWASGLGIAAVATYAILGTRTPSAGIETTRTYTADATHQAALVLDDGTHVTLAPGTTLRLVRFGSRSRAVTLTGEAYFDVAHASGAPFLVHSGSATTRVLGTTFMVRSYAGGTRVHVAVAEGKVTVTPRIPSRKAVTLTAGRVADLSDSSVTVLQIDGFTQETGWANGKISFHDTPLRDVLTALGRWYGYEFRLSDPALTGERVTLVLNTKSLAAALANLEQILSVRPTVAGDTITLTPQPARPANGAHRIRTYKIWTPTKEVGR